MRPLHVPVYVDRIALSPSVCMNATKGEVRYHTTNTYDKGDFLAGHVEMFDEKNVLLKPLLPPPAAEDHLALAPHRVCMGSPESGNSAVPRHCPGQAGYTHHRMTGGEETDGKPKGRKRRKKLGGGSGSAANYVLSNPQLGLNSDTFTDIGVSNS